MDANCQWMQHMIYYSSPKGITGFILANGSLAANTSGGGIIGQAIVENSLVYCIVQY